MDLAATLAQAMGIDESKASAVAGLVLGAAKAQAGPEEAAELEAQVPELGSWVEQAQQEASTAEDQPGLMDDLAGFATSGLGGSLLGSVAGEDAAEKARLVAMMSQLGLSPQHAALAAPVVLSFLEQRLGTAWLDRLMAAAPILTGMKQAANDEGSDALGAVGSALGGLFGGGD